MRHRCFFARFDPTGRPCDGPFDPCHLIPKQRIKREVSTDPLIVWDERVVVHGCRRHHGLADRRLIQVPREALPLSVEDYAQEHGIEWMLDRDYGMAEPVR